MLSHNSDRDRIKALIDDEPGMFALAKEIITKAGIDMKIIWPYKAGFGDNTAFDQTVVNQTEFLPYFAQLRDKKMLKWSEYPILK